jgi:hypothetical protein
MAVILSAARRQANAKTRRSRRTLESGLASERPAIMVSGPPRQRARIALGRSDEGRKSEASLPSSIVHYRMDSR